MVGKMMEKATKITKTNLEVNLVVIIIRVNVHSERVAISIIVVRMNLAVNSGIVGGWQLTERRTTVPRRKAGLGRIPSRQRTIKKCYVYIALCYSIQL